MSEYKLPEKYKAKISRIAKEIEEPNDTLIAEVTDKFMELKAKYPKRSLGALWSLAYFAASNRWRGILRALPWEGFFLGETEVRDWTEIIQRMIDNMPDNEKIKYITESGVYLNPFKKSRNYLDPLPEHRYFKNMYGIIYTPKDREKAAFTVLEWNGDLASKVPVHDLEVTYKFRATQRTSESIRRLGGTKATKFEAVSPDIPRIEKEKMVRELGPFKEFSKLGDYYELVGKKKAAQEIIMTEAGIRTMGKTERSYILTLEAPEDVWVNPITAFVPRFIPLNFGVGSKILVLGTLSTGRGERLVINAVGVFPTVEGIIAPDSDLLGEEEN